MQNNELCREQMWYSFRLSHNTKIGILLKFKGDALKTN